MYYIESWEIEKNWFLVISLPPPNLIVLSTLATTESIPCFRGLTQWVEFLSEVAFEWFYILTCRSPLSPGILGSQKRTNRERKKQSITVSPPQNQNLNKGSNSEKAKTKKYTNIYFAYLLNRIFFSNCVAFSQYMNFTMHTYCINLSKTKTKSNRMTRIVKLQNLTFTGLFTPLWLT